jgi:hypothetical protein
VRPPAAGWSGAPVGRAVIGARVVGPGVYRRAADGEEGASGDGRAVVQAGTDVGGAVPTGPLRVRERTLGDGSRGWSVDGSPTARIVARNILEHGLSRGELVNVNVPAVSIEECEGIEVTRLGRRVYQDQLVERTDPRGIPYFWIGGPPPSGMAIPGTDFHAVVHRRIAVTPIHLDLTGRSLLRRLRTWDWDVPVERSEA